MSSQADRHVSPLTSLGYSLAEGPFWDVRNSRLTWVDIDAGALWCVSDLSGGETPQLLLRGDHALGVAVPHADGGWVCGRGRGVELVSDEGDVLVSVELERSGVRMNDGKADRSGRFWVGSKAEDNAPGAGSLWRIGLDGGITRMLSGLTIANGLGWSPDGSVMYVTDSAAGRITAYECDEATGELGAGLTFVDVDPALGVPDGLSVDTEGFVWTAVWGGACVLRISPDGEAVERVEIPTSHVSSCTFAGPTLDTLVVTSARSELTVEQLAAQPFAGHVFSVVVDAVGTVADVVRVPRQGWAVAPSPSAAL